MVLLWDLNGAAPPPAAVKVVYVCDGPEKHRLQEILSNVARDLGPVYQRQRLTHEQHRVTFSLHCSPTEGKCYLASLESMHRFLL